MLTPAAFASAVNSASSSGEHARAVVRFLELREAKRDREAEPDCRAHRCDDLERGIEHDRRAPRRRSRRRVRSFAPRGTGP